jgi:hypothetical protein
MSSSTPIPRSGRLRTVAVLALLIVLQLPASTIAWAAPPVVAVPAGTMDGQSRLIVDLPPARRSSVSPGSFSVAVAGTPRPTRAGQLMSDRLAMGVVVDTSEGGGSVLQPGLSGVVDFMFATSPATRCALVADTTRPAVLSPLQPRSSDTLSGLTAMQSGGDRQTIAALELAVQQLPLEAENPRLVLLYTAAPAAAGRSAADLGARLSAAGVVLAVITTASDGGPVPEYWSSAAAATGGIALSASGPEVTSAFARLATALRTRYLLTFPAPDRFPAEAVVRVDTPDGPLIADTVLPAATTQPAARAVNAGPVTGQGVGITVVLAVLALLVAGVVAARLRRGQGRGPAPAVGMWNIPARSEPVADRAQLLAAMHGTVQAGEPVVLSADDGRAGLGLGTTTAMIEFAHRNRHEYDVAWWIAAEDPPLVGDRMAQLAEALGLAAPADTAAEATATLLEALRRRARWLLIFDDAASPRELARFLPDGPGHILVGSTDPAWREHGTSLAVPSFSRPESVELLRARRPCLTVAEADRVAAALDDVPLAVDVAGATLADIEMDTDTYLSLLSDHRTGSGTEATATSGAWAVAFDRLAADDPPALALLTIVAWLAPEPVPLSLISRYPDLLPPPLAQTARIPSVLAERAAMLNRRGLARVGPEGGVQLHRLPAAQLVRRTVEERPGHQGWAAWTVRLLRAAVPADPVDPSGWPMWRQLLPHVLTATDPARRLDEVIIDVGWLLNHAGGYLQARGEPRAARALFEDAYDLYRRQLGQEHPDTLASARTLADNLRALGQYEQARRVLQDTHIDSPMDRGVAEAARRDRRISG